jgi:hypothetical protein
MELAIKIVILRQSCSSVHDNIMLVPFLGTHVNNVLTRSVPS